MRLYCRGSDDAYAVEAVERCAQTSAHHHEREGGPQELDVDERRHQRQQRPPCMTHTNDYQLSHSFALSAHVLWIITGACCWRPLARSLSPIESCRNGAPQAAWWKAAPAGSERRRSRDDGTKVRRERRTEDKHPEEVCAAAAEGALFKRLAVLDQEEHVEHEVQSCGEGRSALLSSVSSIWRRSSR